MTRVLSNLNLSEMTGQAIPIIMRILVLIKTNHPDPDQSNAKHYTQRKWFSSKTSWKMPILFKKCVVRSVPARVRHCVNHAKDRETAPTKNVQGPLWPFSF